jgi:hypothetical protein
VRKPPTPTVAKLSIDRLDRQYVGQPPAPTATAAAAVQQPAAPVQTPEPAARPTVRYRPVPQLPAKPEPPADPKWGPVSLFAAGPFNCRFPVTEVHPLADFRFCGARAPFYGYCPAHQAQMWSRRR